MLSNPFTQRSLPSSSFTLTPAYHHSDRHYFPYAPSNTNKPGFLVSSQITLPTVYSDMRSPYSTLGYKEEHKARKQNIDNPFKKPHLIDHSKEAGYWGYGSDTYSYASLAESQVTPVYSNYPKDNYDYSKGYNDKNDTTGLKKKSSSLKSQQFGKKANLWNREEQQIIQQAALSKIIQKKSSPKTPNYNNPQTRSEGYTPLNEEYPKKDLNRNPSYIDKIITEHEEQDDPMTYNLPSFNQKANINMEHKNSIDSPTFNNKSSPIVQDRFRENQAVQANKREGQTHPDTINYKGKIFYLVNTDQL